MDVQAIILAGGYGTRLSPLTEEIPKPLLKVCGKTVLSRVCEKAFECGITNVTVTAMYKPEMLREHLEKEFHGLVNVVCEKEPLGTAGAVKNAYDKKSGKVLVLSGDGIFDFDLNKLLEFHESKKSHATILAAQSEEPLEYGVILSDKDSRITRFLEKPAWEQVISSVINTGIYVLDKDTIDSIPENTKYDFSKQLFPKLMDSGISLYAFRQPKGYWCDIGGLDDYFQCVCDCASGKVNGISFDRYTENELYESGVEFTSPVYISRKAHLGKNVKVGANSFIGCGCEIGNNCVAELSVIDENCKIGDGTGIYSSLLSENVTVGENCVISEGCVLGCGSSVCDGEIIPRYTKIHCKSKIPEDNNMLTSFKNREGGLFCEHGIICKDGSYGPEYYTRLGYALAKTIQSISDTSFPSRLGFMTDHSLNSALYSSLIKYGAMSGGIRCCDYGKGYESLSKFCAASSVCDFFIYTRSMGSGAAAILTNGLSLPVGKEFERKLEKEFFSDRDFSKPDNIYDCENFDGMHLQYYGELIKCAKELIGDGDLSGLELYISTDGVPKSIAPSNLLISVLCELGAKINFDSTCDNRIFISPDGTNAYAQSGEHSADHVHLNALLISKLKLEKLILPYRCPDVYKRIAKSRGISIQGYSAVENGADFAASKRDILNELWLFDGVFAALCYAILLYKAGMDFESLFSGIPNFSVYTDEFITGHNRAGIMEKLSKLDSSERAGVGHDGVKLILSNGTVTVIPGRAAGFRIISEAQNTEAAKELCRKIEGIIGEEK